FIISTLFYSLSYKTGVDWVEYRRLFDDQLSNNNFELGFLSLANIFSYMNINFWIFIFIIKIVFISSLFYFVWKFCDYPSIAICMIIGLLFPFFNDPIRQLIAATMLFSSVSIIKNSPGYINILIGSLFHSSYALLLFSKLKKISKKIIIIVTLTLISIIIVTMKNPQLIQIVGDNFLTRKLLFYISYASPPNLYSLALRIFFISYICISKKVQNTNKRNMPYNTYSLFWVLSFFLLLTEIIAFELPILSQRLRIYLIPFPIIMFLNYIFSQRVL
ncbi:EpsG family protein, partial [Morganella morganii]|nr:EpsG family protein [Morganella morganii]